MRRTAVLLLALAACTPNLAATAKAPELDRPGEAKCGVKKSQSEPLVVEWPSAARAKLEALSRTGVVAVRYQGCEMEVLASCNAPGKYGYTAITPKHDHVAIKNEDDLYASIPLGAARLEGKLESAGELDVDMAIVGRYASDRAVVRADELQGPDCSKATHVVSALEVGAFDFYAGAGTTVGGGASALGAGGGASAKASKELLNSDGRMNGCDSASTSDGKPPEGCGAILRLEVVPLGEAKREARPAPAEAGQDQAAAVGAGGQLELTVPDKDYAFDVTVDAGGKTFSCSEPATYYKPCRLEGLPEGKAHMKVSGTSSFERDVPVSADGRTSVQLVHRGSSYEIVGGTMAVVGGGLIAFSLLNGNGLSSPGVSGDDGTFIANILLLSAGGTLALLGLPAFIGGLAGSHDGLVIQSPGKATEMAASKPALQWGGLSAPTTWRF